jgi:hypothetical protein
MNGSNKLECYITKILSSDKHSTLLETFVIYKENEVLRIRPLGPQFARFYFSSQLMNGLNKLVCSLPA